MFPKPYETEGMIAILLCSLQLIRFEKFFCSVSTSLKKCSGNKLYGFLFLFNPFIPAFSTYLSIGDM